ncbi:MAG: hypothetical protein P8J79_12865 [Halioglobus sp.]|nr:hypothetical protein [Halioglobus sp.]
MAESETSIQKDYKLDLGALIHSGAGILALVLGGLMYFYAWALFLFAGLMIVSAISAVWISWAQNAWVLGHWLAMLPVIGVLVGYLVAPWGFTLAYVCLWIAFIHFIIRGVRTMRREQGE